MKNLVLLALLGYFATTEMSVNAIVIREEPKKEDAKDTFKRLEELKVDYYYKNKSCDESILLAFEKDKNIKIPKKKENSDSCWKPPVGSILK